MPLAISCSACQKSTIYTKNGIAHCRGGNLPPGHFVYKMASPTEIIIYFLRKSQQLLRNYWAGGRLPPLRLLSKISGFLTVSTGDAFGHLLFFLRWWNLGSGQSVEKPLRGTAAGKGYSSLLFKSHLMIAHCQLSGSQFSSTRPRLAFLL